jgi:hypothetical protein
MQKTGKVPRQLFSLPRLLVGAVQSASSNQINSDLLVLDEPLRREGTSPTVIAPRQVPVYLPI